jgi:hypothetical protein
MSCWYNVAMLVTITVSPADDADAATYVVTDKDHAQVVSLVEEAVRDDKMLRLVRVNGNDTWLVPARQVRTIAEVDPAGSTPIGNIRRPEKMLRIPTGPGWEVPRVTLDIV